MPKCRRQFIACIPCLGPCCLLGIPFGIWAFIVLTRSGFLTRLRANKHAATVRRGLPTSKQINSPPPLPAARTGGRLREPEARVDG